MNARPASLPFLDLTLEDPAATARFAEALAPLLRPGDVLALSGDLGAGKTCLARALIQALSPGPVEVPSPTFTLVQTYETRPGAFWHFDLYRIERPEEAYELGIEEAFADAISAIEWPERLGPLLPETALAIELSPEAGGETRRLRIRSPGAFADRLDDLSRRLARPERLENFLKQAGWQEAARQPLAGDASFRRYLRLEGVKGRAVLMDAPPPMENVRPFATIAAWLKAAGYSAPGLLAQDAEQGFLLLEDLGDRRFDRLLSHPQQAVEAYGAAVDLLADLHRRTPPKGLKLQDPSLLLEEVSLVPDWYLPALTGKPCPPTLRRDYEEAWRAALARLPAFPPVLVLRDYFAENLLWLPDRAVLARVGLLDFQDAIAGHPAYDLISLVQDARRALPAELEEPMIERYIGASGVPPEPFRAACALLGAQRAARIVGLWPRLWRRDGKPRYLAFMDQTFTRLEHNLEHPALSPVRAWFDREIPPNLRRRKLPGAPE